MKFRPLHDRVLVRRVEEATKTAGGIIIPDSATEKPQEGEIIAVGGGAIGDDNERVPLDVKVGDKVLFGKWGGTEVKVCLLYTSPSPRDQRGSRMPSSA